MPTLPSDAAIPPATAQALLPVLNAKVTQLAELPPGPAAQTTLADILALLQAIFSTPAVVAALPASWKIIVAAILAIVTALGIGAVGGRVTAPTTPTPAVVPAGPVVPVAPAPPVAPTPVAPVHPPIVADPSASPIQPPPDVKPMKMILYTTSALDAQKLMCDPGMKKLTTTVTIDPKLYPAGSAYPWANKSIPVPCAALLHSDGKVIDVAPFLTAADLAAFEKRNLGK